MAIIIFQIAGAVSFLIATIVLGVIVRKNKSKLAAEKTSRVSHFFYYFSLVIPWLVGIVYPGLTHFDEIIGVRSLPFGFFTIIIGVVLTIFGAYFTALAIKGVKNDGKGAPAFKLTKNVVTGNIYKFCRNPMSLGYYLFIIGVSIAAASTYLTIASIVISIVHAFNLKYFEELELEIRLGDSYKEYKKTVPFLIPKVLAVKK